MHVSALQHKRTFTYGPAWTFVWQNAMADALPVCCYRRPLPDEILNGITSQAALHRRGKMSYNSSSPTNVEESTS